MDLVHSLTALAISGLECLTKYKSIPMPLLNSDCWSAGDLLDSSLGLMIPKLGVPGVLYVVRPDTYIISQRFIVFILSRQRQAFSSPDSTNADGRWSGLKDKHKMLLVELEDNMQNK